MAVSLRLCTKYCGVRPLPFQGSMTYARGGVTFIDPVVTTATAVSQWSTVKGQQSKLLQRVLSMVKACLEIQSTMITVGCSAEWMNSYTITTIYTCHSEPFGRLGSSSRLYRKSLVQSTVKIVEQSKFSSQKTDGQRSNR